ncbi:hypothetical protein [Cognatishimia sp. MH4019]|uniref:hypothetical protein n=1 Tax=Cognatishimia sp. MH4019 TaxID=2854030 RepID=UPI001CD3DC30|nr:hypothetical protein [Cognatishimia sp. MH4019]
MRNVLSSHVKGLSRRLSPGESKLVAACFVGAVFGMFLSWSALDTLSWRTSVAQNDWTTQERWLVFTGTVVLGGLVFFMRKHFGHGGIVGLLRTGIAGLWVLFLAGVITGTLNMPLWGTTFGVIIIAGTIAKSPLVALSGVGALALVHWLCRPWQIERRSIFGYGEMEF